MVGRAVVTAAVLAVAAVTAVAAAGMEVGPVRSEVRSSVPKWQAAATPSVVRVMAAQFAKRLCALV